MALVFGATFQRPARPVSVVVIQAAYEVYLIVGVIAAAALAHARGTGGVRALLSGRGGGGQRPGWIVVGTASAWLAIVVLGTFLPAGDAKARDLAHQVHGWAAVDGWLLVMCALGPLAEELLWRRSIFTTLAGVFARGVGERRAVVFAMVLSSVMFAGWHLLGGDSLATLWERTLLGIVLCLVFWRTGSVLAAAVVHGLDNLGTIGFATVGAPGLPITLHGPPVMAAVLIGLAVISRWSASRRPEAEQAR
jgi:membrane protease YdiL (CAAX protease family)